MIFFRIQCFLMFLSYYIYRNMPDVEELMQEWPPEFEDLLNTVGLPTAELDVDLAQYVDLICGMYMSYLYYWLWFKGGVVS